MTEILSADSPPCVIQAVHYQAARRDAIYYQPEAYLVLEHLTRVCGRTLQVPMDAPEVKGRYHYGKGYIWSWRMKPQKEGDFVPWNQFAIFGGNRKPDEDVYEF